MSVGAPAKRRNQSRYRDRSAKWPPITFGAICLLLIGFGSALIARVPLSVFDTTSVQTPEERARALRSEFEKCARLQDDPARMAAPSVIFDCYLSNARNGYPLAQLKLGFMYHEGIGVQKSLVLSYVWHTVAWSRDRKIGRRYLDKVSGELEVWEIEEAKIITRRCKASSFKDCDFVD